MPIKGLSEKIRMPVLGWIKLGTKRVSKRTGEEYATASEHFVVPEDVAAIYGMEPTELEIQFHSDSDEDVAPQYMKWFGGHKNLICKGDGVTCNRVDKESGGWVEDFGPCDLENCPQLKTKPPLCNEDMVLSFMLPRVSGLGLWQIGTGSKRGIINVNSALRLVKLATGCGDVARGKLVGIPFILSLKMERCRFRDPKDGKIKSGLKPILHLTTTKSIAELEAIGRGESDDAEPEQAGQPDNPVGLTLTAVAIKKIEGIVDAFGYDKVRDALQSHAWASLAGVTDIPTAEAFKEKLPTYDLDTLTSLGNHIEGRLDGAAAAEAT